MTDIPDFDEISLARLAREMAMNIRPYKTVFKDYNLDEEQYYELLKIDFYKRALDQFTLEWNATTSTADRVKIESLAYHEHLLPILTRRAADEKTSLSDATDVAKMLARTAGLGEAKDNGSNSAEKFIISINLGADLDGKPVIEHYEKSIAIDVDPIKPTK